MDTNFLTTQVSTIISQLHGLFDEIGVPSHEVESRESELFAALSETLNDQVRIVSAEKSQLKVDAERIVKQIKQMEDSLGDNKNKHEYEVDPTLEITYPLMPCVQGLKEKHLQISRIHKERVDQVKQLVQALESYSSHLEASFVKIKLPPSASDSAIPLTFDLSQAYIDVLDNEFTRVYEEYARRVATVQALAEHIVQLWAELGTPQAQTDSTIVKYCRESPEQLGLHVDDVGRLRAKCDKLGNEKKARERKLDDLKATVEGLWERLNIDEYERKQFLNSNRGCGVRQINEFEDELSRLNELKRQNLHLFVEDARYKLQEIWDALYFCEEEMLEFTPAFSDVYSDALLEAHEQEIARLEALKEQRAPTLALIDKHRSLVKDRDELAASSQDASRLMMRGQKGEKRDPTRLLREEKMRKRIAKELPKVAVEVRKALDRWEDEYGRPFLVHGERYIDELDASEVKQPGPRSKTPAGPAAPTGLSRSQSTKSVAPSRTASTRSTMQPPPSRAGAKTPATCETIRSHQFASSMSVSAQRSPTRIPTQTRAPLSNIKHGINSPERHGRSESRFGDSTIRKMCPPSRGPPPKMRDIFAEPQTPVQDYRHASVESAVSVRPVALEDPYEDRQQPQRPQSYHSSSMRADGQRMGYISQNQVYPAAPSTRQPSNTSSHTSSSGTVISGSENWETYDDVSEPDSESTYQQQQQQQAMMRGSQYKRDNPYEGYGPPQAVGLAAKRQRGLLPPPAMARQIAYDQGGPRTVSSSEANWTDDGEPL